MQELMQILRAASNTPYRPHFGDPEPIDWAITVFYLLSFIGCVLNAKSC